MSKKTLLPAFTLALIFTVATASVSMATPKALSATFSKNAEACGLWWFDKDWNLVWIEGEGRLIQPTVGGFVMTCHFQLDFNDPTLLSREAFCAEDWAKFMCKGNGGLVDNRTTCNLEGIEVHNGTVAAGPSGQGEVVCHVK